MPAIVAGIMMGTAAVGKVTTGLIGMNNAKKKLREFEDSAKLSFYTPEQLQMQSENAVRFGYTPEEQASFQQGMSRANTKQLQTAQQINPNLSAQVQAGINFGNVDKLLRFAEASAREKQRKIEQKYRDLERADVREVSQNQQIAGQYGQSVSDYRTLMMQGLSDLSGGAGYLLGKGVTGNGSAPAGGATPQGRQLGSGEIPSAGARNPLPGTGSPLPGTDEWTKERYLKY